MYNVHSKLLDKRYAEAHERAKTNGGFPDSPPFDGSPEGLENITLRVIKDYTVNGNPDTAFTDALAWVKRAYEAGKNEERWRIEERLLEQTKAISAKFIADVLRR